MGKKNLKRAPIIRKRKNKYRDFLDAYNLESEKFDHVSAVDKKNILLKNMIYLVRLKKLTEKDYFNHMNLIRLLSAELYFLSNNFLDADTLLQLDERINDVLESLNLVLINENLEQEIVAEFIFPPTDQKKYFDYNRLYSIIASAFSAPFLNYENHYYFYQYAYYLSMYLNLHYYANVETKNLDYKLFSAKLLVQEKMIFAIKKISPHFFNLFIIKTNKWISQINFKKLTKDGD